MPASRVPCGDIPFARQKRNERQRETWLSSIREQAGALQERQFRLLWLGQTASAIGDSVIFVALPFAVLQTGGGAAELGLVLAAFTLARARASSSSEESGPTAFLDDS